MDEVSPPATMAQSIEQMLRRTGAQWRNPSRWSYGLVLPWVVMILSLVSDSHDARDIASRQEMASGTITAHDSRKRPRYEYTFSVEGRAFRGWQIPEGSQKWTVGQPVIVYYDSRDPTKNALRDFSERSLDALGPLPFLFAATTGVLLLIFLLRRSAAAPRVAPRSQE